MISTAKEEAAVTTVARTKASEHSKSPAIADGAMPRVRIYLIHVSAALKFAPTYPLSAITVPSMEPV